MKISCVLLSLFICIYTNAQHANILISATNQPEEPSIMLSTKNVKYMVAGANIRSAFYSSDTGRTWTQQSLSSSFGVWGDPAIVSDTSGNFYFFHLSNPSTGNFIDRIVCQKSTNNGVTWSNGSATGLNGLKEQDKQWAVVDSKNNNIYVTWTQFDDYGSIKPTDSSIILFSKSVDGGITWNNPIRINNKAGDCIDSDNTTEGAVPAVGPNGEVYVSWAGPNGLVFNKSLDGGATWMKTDKIINSIPGGWDFNIPGIFRANGLPITVCDLSNKPTKGTIYVNWCDQRNGVNNTDVWLVKSTDGGTTWTSPIKVNDDLTDKQQFLTWMSIDQVTGYLYFVFYDRRNYTDNQTDVYMARSVDGGLTFQNFKISESPFAPTSNVFFGDYNNLTTYNNVIRPIWTRMDNGNLSIWTSLIDTAKIPKLVNNIPSTEDVTFDVYPNPFTNNSYISFKLKKASIVSLNIYDATGRIVRKPIQNKRYDVGKYVENLQNWLKNLSEGVYFYTIIVDEKLYTRKIIRVY